MVAASDIAAFRTALDQLSVVSFAQIKALLGQVDDANPLLIRDRLLEAFPEVIAPYVTASGELSAAWYEDLRAGMVGGSYAASVTTQVAPERVDALVRYSLKPLFQGSSSTVLNLLAGGTQRIIANAARDTIIGNVMGDRVRVGYARIPRVGCCAFCSMLASRGAVYNSRESAGGVVGRGVDASVTAGKRGGQGKGVKARGERELGSNKYHDFCRCLPAPVFVGDTFHKEVEEKHMGLYLNGGGDTTKEALANMRAENGTR